MINKVTNKKGFRQALQRVEQCIGLCESFPMTDPQKKLVKKYKKKLQELLLWDINEHSKKKHA